MLCVCVLVNTMCTNRTQNIFPSIGEDYNVLKDQVVNSLILGPRFSLGTGQKQTGLSIKKKSENFLTIFVRFLFLLFSSPFYFYMFSLMI